MANQYLLDGDVAVVTGAGRNVGEGISNIFASEGATIVVNDVDEERAQRVVDSLDTSNGQDHTTLVLDATDPQTVQAASETVSDRFGSVDVLVNNLGYAENKSVFDVSVDEWRRTIDLTLTSTFLWTKYFGPIMADSGGGEIVNLASNLAHEAIPEKAAYCAAKGGVLNLTRQLAIDLAEDDIRVNSISPGLIGDPVGTTTPRDPEVHEQRVPLNRIGTPTDIGNAALFLVSDLSGYVTGADLSVDGGLSA